MKFKDVQLQNSGRHSEEKLEQNKYLMFYWENIRNLFCMNLPDDIDLLGISKLNIQLGKFEGDSFLKPDNRGIAVFKRSDFQFEEFRQLSEEDKDDASLNYVEDSLLTICDQFYVPSTVKNVFRRAANSVRECNFEYKKVHPKTSKWHKSKRMRAVTTLHFKKGGIDAVLEILDQEGGIVSRHKIIESGFWEVVWFDLWKGSWKDNSFVIEGRTGETLFEIHSSI